MLLLSLKRRQSGNSNIMRPVTFDPNALRRHLLHHKIADLADLKRALGTTVDVTVFRKLKRLDSLSSYSHRGGYYTLREIVRFDDQDLWSFQSVCFSRHGTLLATVESFVNRSPRGYFAEELARLLHVETQAPLRALVQRGRLGRSEVGGLFLYTSTHPSTRRSQILARRTAQAVPMAAAASLPKISPDEFRAAILLFYSLLDEQQRRLYAGLESIKLGRGGDTLLAEFLGLDSHTVARGRQQLLSRNVETARVRRYGGGRKPTEKKRLK